VFIDNTTVINNGGNGVNVNSTALTFVSIENSRFELNTFGVNASNFSQVVVRHSVANGNSSVGFLGSAGAGTAEMDIFDSMAGNNTFTGVQAGGGGATSTVRISNVAVFGNPNGFVVGSGGSLKSFGNNFNSGGGTPTAPNLTPQ
jgi:hypothetical protein